MSIKYYLNRVAAKITGRKCSTCKHNCGGRCAHPSDRAFSRCWNSITRPDYEERPAEPAPGDMTPEEKYQLAQIVTTLQEASATARDGGLLED